MPAEPLRPISPAVSGPVPPEKTPGVAAEAWPPTAPAPSTPQLTIGRTAIKLGAVLLAMGLLGTLVAAAVGRARELGRRAKCGRLAAAIVTGQNNYASDRNLRGQPAAYVRGTEAICYTRTQAPPANATQSTDASRAYLYMAKQGLLDTLQTLSCPGDPFVAVLDAPGKRFGPLDTDIPEEGKPVTSPSGWASGGSPAERESGHTYMSYSMQSGSAVQQAMLHPYMSARIPVAAERNPWCVSAVLGLVSPIDGSAAGNAWNHNREGQTIAFADGHTDFLADARMLEIPPGPTLTAATGAFSYLYDDGTPSPTGGNLPSGRCVPPGTPARTVNFTAWLTE